MRPFPKTDEGRGFLITWLKKNGFEDIKGTSGQYDHWDVEAVKGGKTWVFELKNRDHYFDYYNDAILEMDKVNHLKESPADYAVYVCFWIDKWCMINVRTMPYYIKNRPHPKTSCFSNRSITRTDQATWDNITKFLDYNLDD